MNRCRFPMGLLVAGLVAACASADAREPSFELDVVPIL